MTRESRFFAVDSVRENVRQSLGLSGGLGADHAELRSLELEFVVLARISRANSSQPTAVKAIGRTTFTRSMAAAPGKPQRRHR
jgi:hypothetical protein